MGDDVTQEERNRVALGRLVAWLAMTLGEAPATHLLQMLDGEHDDLVRAALRDTDTAPPDPRDEGPGDQTVASILRDLPRVEPRPLRRKVGDGDD